MSANVIAWRRIQTLNARLNEQFVHAVTWSHGSHWLWTCIRHDGSSATVDQRDMSVVEDDDSDITTTQYLLRTRQTGNREHLKLWLQELDERVRHLPQVIAGG